MDETDLITDGRFLGWRETDWNSRGQVGSSKLDSPVTGDAPGSRESPPNGGRMQGSGGRGGKKHDGSLGLTGEWHLLEETEGEGGKAVTRSLF